MDTKLGPETRVLRFQGRAADVTNSFASFEICTADEKAHSFWFPTSDIPAAAAYLLNLGQSVMMRSGGLKPPSAGPESNSTPAVAFKLAPGRNNSEVFVSVHIGLEKPLVFSTTPKALAEFRDVLIRSLVEPQPTKRD